MNRPGLLHSLRRALLWPAFSLAMAVQGCAAIPIDREIVVVTFNDNTAAALGLEWNRSAIADITEYLIDAGAKSVVIKMFLDTPGIEEVDARLERQFLRGRVILQAGISAEPPLSSFVASRFRFGGEIKNVAPLITGEAGWVPIPRFQNAATKVCFTDVTTVSAAPVLERFAGHLYKSLYTCILEEAVQEDLVSVQPGISQVGPWLVESDSHAVVNLKLAGSFKQVISAEDLMHGMALPFAVKGKVSIIAYSGAKSPTISVDGVPTKVHEAFLMALHAFLEGVQKSGAPR